MSIRPARRAWILLAIGMVMAPIGCSPKGLDTTYGRSRGASINGTGAFAELLRLRGHEVRTALRTTESLANWADVIVRFSPHPGLPDRDEGEWLEGWLSSDDKRRKLVYVVRDFDGESEFWDAVIASGMKGIPPDRVEAIKRKRDASKLWAGDLPPKAKEPAREPAWFKVGPKPPEPGPCKALDGPWAEEVDVASAAVNRHETFVVEQDEPILLIGDGEPLVVSWSFASGGDALAIANASFLTNSALLNHARRPLAIRVVDWIGGPARHVAFVEGARPMRDQEDEGADSPFRLFQVPPFNWVIPQMIGFLFLLALAYAVRPGRPSPEPPSGVEKPSAHPEALGALLARTRRADAARFLLETYRRWRHPSLAPARKAQGPPPSPRVPRS